MHFSGAKKYRFRVLEAVEAVNELQKVRVVEKLEKMFGAGGLKGKRIGVWGLAFKPRTDDMREAPAVPIVNGLLARGAHVQVFDPEAMKVARGIFGSKVHYAKSAYDALTGADALAIVTEWNEFREPDLDRMKSLMKAPIIVDGRNLYQPEEMRAAGFTYVSIGRS
jgi:UDPglucose 6-dehydrogenase